MTPAAAGRRRGAPCDGRLLGLVEEGRAEPSCCGGLAVDEYLGPVAVAAVILVVLYLVLVRGGDVGVGDQPFPWIVLISVLAAIGYIAYFVYDFLF